MLSILISSTFNDMQAERDIIRTRVAPALRQVAAEYGQSVRLLDLRWGVNTASMSEEAAAQKVLDVCLDEIDRCDSYMVCLLGNRYGWVPDYSRLEDVAKRGLDLPTPVSVTELEIQYGILQRNEGERAIVFFRDEVRDLPPELESQYCDGDGDLRQWELKRRLDALPGTDCGHYALTYRSEGEFDGLNEFAARLLEQLTALVRKSFGGAAPATPAQKRQKLFESIIAEYMDPYLPIPELEEELSAFAGGEEAFLVVRGQEGMGKTALASRICAAPPPGVTVIPYFCGAGSQRSRPQDILTHYIEALLPLTGGDPPEEQASLSARIESFSELISRVETPVWFVADGMDQVDAPENDRFAWLPRFLPETVRFVLTTTPGDRTARQLGEVWPVRDIVLPPLDGAEEFLRLHLAAQGKEIPQALLQTVTTSQLSRTPLFCEMVVRMLMLLDRHDFAVMNRDGGSIDSINSYIMGKLTQLPDTLEAMAFLFLYDCSEQVTPGVAAPFLSAIACSPMGLRAQDLQALFPDLWDEAEFAYLSAFLDGYLVQDDSGCYRLARPLLRNACLRIADDGLLEQISDYLRTLPDNDPVKAESSLTLFLLRGWYDDARRLILSNPGAPMLSRQAAQQLALRRAAVSRLLQWDEVLDWFLREVIPLLHERPTLVAAVRLLRDRPASANRNLETRRLQTLAQLHIRCGEKRQAYDVLRKLLHLNEEENTPLSAAHTRVQLTGCAFLEMGGDAQTIRDLLQQAIDRYEQEPSLPDSAMLYYCRGRFYKGIFALQEEFGFSYGGTISLKDYHNRKDQTDSAIGYVDTILMAGLHFISGMEKNITPALVQAMLDLCELGEQVLTLQLTHPEDAVEYGQLLLSILSALNRVDDAAGPLEGICLEDSAELLDEFRIRRKDLSARANAALSDHLSGSCHAPSLKLLALLQLQLASITDDLDEQAAHLEHGGGILMRYFSQDPLSEFADDLAKALLRLAACRLKQGRQQEYDAMLEVWGAVVLGSARTRIAECLEECRRYPDEVHWMELQQARANLQNLWEEYAQRLWLRDRYHAISSLDSLFAISKVGWSKGKDYTPKEICTPLSFYAMLFLVKDLQAQFENEELDEIHRRCLPAVLQTLLRGAHRILTMMKSRLSEDAEEELLRPEVYSHIAAKFAEQYLEVCNERNLELSQRERQQLAFQLAQLRMQCARYQPDQTEELARSVLHLLDLLTEQLNGGEIPGTWLYDEVSLRSIRQLSCQARVALGDTAYGEKNYWAAVTHYRLALDLCLLLQGAVSDRPAEELLLRQYVLHILPNLLVSMEVLNRLDWMEEVNAKADFLLNRDFR